MFHHKKNIKTTHRGYVLLPVLLVLLLLLFTPLMPQADAQAEGSKEDLLTEIAERIERYYLFAPEAGVSLDSLDELSQVWQDPHSSYLPEDQFELFTDSLGRSLTGIGAYLEKGAEGVTVVSTVPDAPAEQAGIKSGDLIEAVDGQVVLDYPLEKVVALLRGKEGTVVQVTVRRGEEQHEFTLVRAQIILPNLEHVLLDDDLALLRLYNFDTGVAREASHLLQELQDKGVRGVVLDLRANQGGYVEEALALASLFAEGILLQVKEKAQGWEKVKGQDAALFDLPLVVLVNKGSASGAEIVAAALRDNKAALVVGAETFGKGTMQTVMPLRHGGYLKLTTAEFASPHLHSIEGVGVEPHFKVQDPKKQEDLAGLLLRFVLQQEQGAAGYLSLLLQEQGEEQGSFEHTLTGRGHYPLRALLALTGRPIVSEDTGARYTFSMRNITFYLDLQEMLLSWTDHTGREQTSPVLLMQGRTYVPLTFLKEGFGLPYLH